jgi:hypothetical protein
LKWREIVSIGRATALWALLFLSETPPAEMLRAMWLLQAIAAAPNLQPSDLVRYLNTLHLVVQNFESVRGTFPLAFLHQLLSTLVLTTLEKIRLSCYDCSCSGLAASIMCSGGCGYVRSSWDGFYHASTSTCKV